MARRGEVGLVLRAVACLPSGCACLPPMPIHVRFIRFVLLLNSPFPFPPRYPLPGCSINDLMVLNPGAYAARPGDTLALPCYLPGRQLTPSVFGGDTAWLQFTGGNERGIVGRAGAMAASGTNDHMPNQ